MNDLIPESEEIKAKVEELDLMLLFILSLIMILKIF